MFAFIPHLKKEEFPLSFLTQKASVEDNVPLMAGGKISLDSTRTVLYKRAGAAPTHLGSFNSQDRNVGYKYY